MNRSKLSLAGTALAMMILILDSRAAGEAAREGVELCIRTVIPSLFPFFLVSGLMTGNISGECFVGRFFHAPAHCGTVILTGFLSGYPVGAKLAAQQYRTGFLTKSQAERLLWFCSQAGPSFFFGILPAQMGSVWPVWKLWAVQFLSALSVAWILPLRNAEETAFRNAGQTGKTDLMSGALKAMGSVCGWIILFRVILSFMQRWFLWIWPDWIQLLLSGLLELTNGCLMLGQIEDVGLRFLLAAVMLNFGGLCVMMQTRSVTSGLEFRGYIRGKCVQTLFSFLYANLFLGHSWPWLPLLCVVSRRYNLYTRKKCSIPARTGV